MKTAHFPKSRIATIDVSSIGVKRHHIVALLEIDVTGIRRKISDNEIGGNTISFTGWMLKAIAHSLKKYEHLAGFLKGKRTVAFFEDITISLLVEKELNGHKIPLPLLIEKADKRSIQSISSQITEAKNQIVSGNNIVLQKRSLRFENLYFLLPGFIRRLFWRYLIKHPRLAFNKMGNVSVNSVGMKGNADGWFIPIAIHPVCFGIGRIFKKPAVVDDKIEIREMVKVTVLMDHDVADGGDMTRFISSLTEVIENASEIDQVQHI